MSRQVNVTEAKATLIALLVEVAGGEEVGIMRRGRLLARIVPAESGHALRGCASTIAASSAVDAGLFRTRAGGDAGS